MMGSTSSFCPFLLSFFFEEKTSGVLVLFIASLSMSSQNSEWGELLRVKKWVVDPVPTWLGDNFNCLMMMQLAGMDLFINIHALPCTCYTNNLFLYA